VEAERATACARCRTRDERRGGRVSPALIRRVQDLCLSALERDVFALLERLCAELDVGEYGPVHHALVPGVILAVYRNRGGELDDETIARGIDRGAHLHEGWCGLAGACGAALGVGVAFALILDTRSTMAVTASVLEHLARLPEPCSCRREVLLALQRAVELSRTALPLPLADDRPNVTV